MDRENYNLYSRAIRKWGIGAQCDMVIEEMAELTKEILKSRRKGLLHNQKEIVEELVDVEIMIGQLKVILSDHLHSFPPLYHNLRNEKLNRLKEMLENEPLQEREENV